MRRQRQITIKPLDYGVELVQQFLEPQLVNLMDYYEQHLIMLGRIGKQML
jgi:hypothetical protein